MPTRRAPEEIKRGPLWIVGRWLLVAAAVAILAAAVFAPRNIEDRGPLAITYIKQWQAHAGKPEHFDGRVFEYYKFTVKGDTILAIPVDPRQRSFYSAVSGAIHYCPGTQAATAESPVID